LEEKIHNVVHLMLGGQVFVWSQQEKASLIRERDGERERGESRTRLDSP
jgi:hypothetical protein